MLAQLADDRLTVAQALGVADNLARLRRLEQGEGSLDDAIDADWTLTARLHSALVDTGLPAMRFDRPIASLSGGERTRSPCTPVDRGAGPAAARRAHQQSRRRRKAGGGRTARPLAGRHPARQATTPRLLERVDRIVELTPVGVTVFGGACPISPRRAMRRGTRAEAELGRASDALRNTERAVQKAREKKARRDKAGRAYRASGNQLPSCWMRKSSAPKTAAPAKAVSPTAMIGDRSERSRKPAPRSRS